ncbi:MAG: mechanosensitive ion channel family protein [Phycisphaeraceae bacterium]|nr:mechanosensitive ion channel family protein [Phycisphaeraceae bacterium]
MFRCRRHWAVGGDRPAAIAWALACLLLVIGTGVSTVRADASGVEAGSDSAPSHGEVDGRLVSPRQTMLTFLTAFQGVATDWASVTACLDLSDPELVPDDPRTLARHLYGILNRIELIDVDELPSAARVRELGIERYVFFPDPDKPAHGRIASLLTMDDPFIALRRGADGAWRFSPRTVQNIPRLYEQFLPLPIVAGRDERFLTLADSIEWWLERNVSRTLAREGFGGMRYWQWLTILLIIFAGVVLDHTVRVVIRLLLKQTFRRHDAKARLETIQDTVRPIGIAAAALFWLAVVTLMGLPELPEIILLTAIRVMLILSMTWAAWRITDLVTEAMAQKAARTRIKIDDILVPLLRKAIKVFIVVVGLIYAANTLRIDIVPLLTGLGIGSLAFAFAAKDTVENFFGSVAVILDRPFEVGDWVVVGDTEGIVEELGFRSTRIRTFYNSQITLPNASLVRATVDNYGRRKYRRWFTHVGVQYNTPPEKLTAFVEGIREIVRHHPYTRKDYYVIYLNEFGPSSLNVLVCIFWSVPDWAVELRERERFMLDTIRLADQLGVSFAFPTQTLHVFRGKTATEPASSPPDQGTDDQAIVSGRQTARRIMARQPWRKEKPGPVTYAAEPIAPEIDPQTGKPVENFIEDRSAGG